MGYLSRGSPERVLVGGGCSVRRSDDGGETFFRLPFTARDVGCPANVTSFSFPTDRTGYLLLADGRVLATADGGRSFSRRTPVPGAANDILCTAERTCFAAGASGGVQRTSDGGVSWTHVGSSSPFALFGLERVNPLTLYAVGASLTLLRSVDGGKTWVRKTVRNVPLNNLTSIRCGDVLHCLASTQGASGGQLLRTVDGGETFTSIVPSPDATFAVGFSGLYGEGRERGDRSARAMSNDSGGTWAAVGNRIAKSFDGDAGAPQALTLSTRRRTVTRGTRVVVGGRLTPADGGEEILIARLAGGRWSLQVAQAASNGSYSTRWRVDRSSVFVAQVLGDADHAGAGTPPLTMTVRQRPRS
jgi:hypothetical protein